MYLSLQLFLILFLSISHSLSKTGNIAYVETPEETTHLSFQLLSHSLPLFISLPLYCIAIAGDILYLETPLGNSKSLLSLSLSPHSLTRSLKQEIATMQTLL